MARALQAQVWASPRVVNAHPRSEEEEEVVEVGVVFESGSEDSSCAEGDTNREAIPLLKVMLRILKLIALFLWSMRIMSEA